MKIENFNNITIAYMRNVGEYGSKNTQLMEDFKHYLRSQNLFDEDAVLLGIALDNPMITPTKDLRYDVGIIIEEDKKIDLDSRKIDDGKYAIFEIAHTEQDIISFWQNLPQYTMHLHVDKQKPIIERYAMEKIENHMCEFCIPLK